MTLRQRRALARLLIHASARLSPFEQGPRAWRADPWQRRGLGGRARAGREWGAVRTFRKPTTPILAKEVA